MSRNGVRTEAHHTTSRLPFKNPALIFPNCPQQYIKGSYPHQGDHDFLTFTLPTTQ